MLLRPLQNGTFLIRPSKKYTYTLDIKCDLKILHVAIINENDSYRLLAHNGHEPEIFKSLEEVINFYLENPLHVMIAGEIQTIYIKNLLLPHMH